MTAPTLTQAPEAVHDALTVRTLKESLLAVLSPDQRNRFVRDTAAVAEQGATALDTRFPAVSPVLRTRPAARLGRLERGGRHPYRPAAAARRRRAATRPRRRPPGTAAATPPSAGASCAPCRSCVSAPPG